MSTTSIIELDRVCKTFRVAAPFARTRVVRALRDVSFRVESGGALALVGESGSGKSTCARAIAGLTDLTSGRVLFRGTDIASIRHRKARLAYAGAVQMVFQDPFSALNPTRTVRHHLTRPLRLHGRGDGDLEEETRQALLRVELEPDTTLGKYPHELSGGELQRVNLARALAVGADLIIADEPTSMLDVSIRRSVLDLIRRLRETRGITVVAITHDIATAGYLADEIAVMFAGRIVEYGPTATILTDPQHPYSQLLISALPRASVDRMRESAQSFTARAEAIRAATLASTADLVEGRPGHFVRDVQVAAAT